MTFVEISRYKMYFHEGKNLSKRLWENGDFIVISEEQAELMYETARRSDSYLFEWCEECYPDK